MKFKLVEEKDFNQSIYSGKNSNNEINKKKYKKHSMSPFVSLDAGDVEHNIEVFNNSVAENGSENSAFLSMGESISDGKINTIKSIINELKSGLDFLEDK